MMIIIFLAILALFSYFLSGSFYSESSFSESCGHVFNVSTNTHYGYSNCNDPSYELVCENNRTVLYVNYGRHLVEALYASNSSSTTLEAITAGLDINNCSAISYHSLPSSNFSHAFTDENYYHSVDELVFVSCENPVDSDSPLNTDIVTPCTPEAPKSLYSYVLTRYPKISQVAESCKVEMMVKVSPWGPMTCNENCSYPKVHSQEVKGIHIKWRPNRCGVWEGDKSDCWFENSTNMVLCHSRDGTTFGELFEGFMTSVIYVGKRSEAFSPCKWENVLVLHFHYSSLDL